MDQKLHDLLVRVARTFVQGALGIFIATYIGPVMQLLQDVVNAGAGGDMPEIDLSFWRNALLAIVAGGMIAVVSLVHNLINDYLNKGNDLPMIGKPADRAIGDQVLGDQP